jgi:hypothetical protein
MPSKRSYRYIIVVIALFTSLHAARASFEITEIMYDTPGSDANREWIEVQNTGQAADDLSKWYVASDNAKHAIIPQGPASVPAGSYAVIVQNPLKFKADWPNYSGLLFDSSWSGFNNTSESISLKDPALTFISPVTFASREGAGGDGNSLQKIGGLWKASTPTPGEENKFNAPIVKQEVIAPTSEKIVTPNVKVKSALVEKKAVTPSTSTEIIDLGTLKGSAADSAFSGMSIKALSYIGLALIILIGSLSIFLFRKKHMATASNGLTADDIHIED